MSHAPDLTFSTLSARLIDTVRLNQTIEVQRGGKSFLLKRRYRGRSWIICCGNLFLWLANSKIVMFPDVTCWQAWEVHSFILLHRAECYTVNSDAVMSEKLPGKSLKYYLEAGLLTETMVQAAGREFKRVHSLHSSVLGGLWSHGDSHLENVLYDAEADNAYLIDFETRHWEIMDEVERHADDLLVFLLDLLGRTQADNWQQFALVFLSSYGRIAPIHGLYERLKLPSGFELILWKTRTANLSTEKLRNRVTDLSNIIVSIS